MAEIVKYEWRVVARRYSEDGVELGASEPWGDTVGFVDDDFAKTSSTKLEVARLIGIQVREVIEQKVLI